MTKDSETLGITRLFTPEDPQLTIRTVPVHHLFVMAGGPYI